MIIIIIIIIIIIVYIAPSFCWGKILLKSFFLAVKFSLFCSDLNTMNMWMISSNKTPDEINPTKH